MSRLEGIIWVMDDGRRYTQYFDALTGAATHIEVLRGHTLVAIDNDILRDASDREYAGRVFRPHDDGEGGLRATRCERLEPAPTASVIGLAEEQMGEPYRQWHEEYKRAKG